MHREIVGCDWQKIFTNSSILGARRNGISNDLVKEIIQKISESERLPSWKVSEFLAKWYRRVLGVHAKEVSKVYVFIR